MLTNMSMSIRKHLEESKGIIRVEYLPKGLPGLSAVEECWRKGKDELLVSRYYSKFDQLDTIDDEQTTTTISQETRLKIEELKRLVFKYPQYHSNPGAVIACVIHFCNEDDNSFLNKKLEQLRTIDSAVGYPRM